MQKHDVKLARRQSGGGTVFHDLGNLNFSFFSPRKNYDKRRNLEIVASALGLFNLDPNINERNDIVISHHNQSYKVSGSAFREGKDFAFHHGTLLLDANISLLRECLRAPKVDIEATGVKSVRSKVINLKELNPHIHYEAVLQAIVKQFLEHYQTHANIELFEDKSRELLHACKQNQKWEWLYGKTLPFVHRFKTANGSFIELHVKKGLISHVETSISDFPDLTHCPYSAIHLERMLSKHPDIKDILLKEIP